ncbi:MAG: hypothetical protein HY906_10660 [Deltaproteobacteria bacterium]|nr:hypothetical protein [Deltaproteobacteria bacterium]
MEPRSWRLTPATAVLALAAAMLLYACNDGEIVAGWWDAADPAHPDGQGRADAWEPSQPSNDARAPDVPEGAAHDAGAGVAAGVGDSAAAGDDASPLPRDHARCGWIGAGDTAGYAAFAARPSFYDVIHPDWYALGTDSVSVRRLTGADDSTVLAAAAASQVQVWPLVAGVDDVTLVRTLINDPALRSQHVANLVDLAVSKGYAGLDMDYEHLWDAADKAPFAAFVHELSVAMHAAGKRLSAAVPALWTSSSSWDMASLSQSLDVLHLMGYDFHGIGSPHGGPTAPLGWIQAVCGYAASLGHPERFVLGLPNYGLTPSFYCALVDCAAECTGPIATSTDEMQACPFNEGDWAAGRSLSCDSPHGRLYFDDTQSLEEKVQAARAHGLGGVTYWTVGSEPSGFFAMIQNYY